MKALKKSPKETFFGKGDGTKNGNSPMALDFKLSGKDVKILLLIQQEKNTNKLISKNAKFPKSTISRHTNRLKKLRLIKSIREFNITRFSLTEKGKHTCSVVNTLVSEKKAKQLPIRSHGIKWISEITRKPANFEELLKGGNFSPSGMRGWTKYRKKVQGCTIVINPRVVEFFVHEYFSENQDEFRNDDNALSLIYEYKINLMEEFHGLVLGRPQKVAQLKTQEHARQFDPLAMEFWKTSQALKYSVVFHGRNIDIDFSKGIPELEGKNKHLAPEQLIDLGNFYDDWVENPISVNELHKSKQITENVENKLNKLVDITGNMVKQGMMRGEQDRLMTENMKSHLELINKFKEESDENRKDTRELMNVIKSQLKLPEQHISGKLKQLLNSIKQPSDVLKYNLDISRLSRTDKQRLENYLFELEN